MPEPADVRLGLGGGVGSTTLGLLLDIVWESVRRWKVSRHVACEDVVVRNVGPVRRESSEEEARTGGRIDGGMGGYGCHPDR